MWTKHQSAKGSLFYYNSALNQSAWNPPANAVIHEAVHPLLSAADYQHYLLDSQSVIDIPNGSYAHIPAVCDTSQPQNAGDVPILRYVAVYTEDLCVWSG